MPYFTLTTEVGVGFTSNDVGQLLLPLTADAGVNNFVNPLTTSIGANYLPLSYGARDFYLFIYFLHTY